MKSKEIISRYAVLSEINTAEFMSINEKLNEINVKYKLTDHAELNRARYPWSQKYLKSPQFYASRLWEYPWAVISAELKPGMRCADVGCGESPFTVYLKEYAGGEVTGFDPDIHKGENKDNFGVSEAFLKNTGLNVIQSSIDDIRSEDNRFDRVFCLSVIEHIRDFDVRARGMREISRILKPGGLAVVTVDVNLMMRLSNPLELAWESGLTFHGGVDLTMPEERLGVFCDGRQSADVFGFVLRKSGARINTEYGGGEKVEAWKAGLLRDNFPVSTLENLLRNDLRRNTVNGKPGALTLLRIAAKFMLRKYPGTF